MTEFPYLICIALIDQEGTRLMPLGGKSLKEPIDESKGPEAIGKEIALEVLLRVLGKSESCFLRQAAGKESFLLIEISIEDMQEKLPIMKADWIQTGDTEKLFSKLNKVCRNVWRLTFEKHKGIDFSSCF